MSVSAPPRPGTPGGAGGAPRGSSSHAGQRGDGVILGDQPIRRPDTRSPRVMTRRAWWLVVLNFLLPGSAQSLAGSRRLARVGLTATLVMWLLVIAGVGVTLVSPGFLTSLMTNGFFLLLVQIVLLALTLFVTALTVVPGRATLQQAGVHLALFAAFISVSVAP